MRTLTRALALLLLLGLAAAPGPQSRLSSGSASLFSATLRAQEPAAESGGAAEQAAGEQAAGDEHDLLHDIFHYFNFLALAGAVVYLIRKLLVPFLNERGRLIREDMQKSAQAIEQATARLKAMEDRMGNLDRELALMREAGLNEARAERARIEREAEAEATKMLAAASMEMDSAVKAARQELQAYASKLALDVAEAKIREGLTPQSDKQILDSFISRLASAGDGDAAGRKS